MPELCEMFCSIQKEVMESSTTEDFSTNSSSHVKTTSFNSETASKQNNIMNRSSQDVKTKKMSFACGVIIQAVCIGFFWMLLLIPIILFQLPDSVYVSYITYSVTVYSLPWYTRNSDCSCHATKHGQNYS